MIFRLLLMLSGLVYLLFFNYSPSLCRAGGPFDVAVYEGGFNDGFEFGFALVMCLWLLDVIFGLVRESSDKDISCE